MLRKPRTVLFAGLLAGCAPENSSSQQGHVTLDTASDLAWAQYQENLRFASAYEARCQKTAGRPRVLVTGFGRFQDKPVNATGLVVSELLDELAYPFTAPPGEGQVDPPEPQTAVAQGTIELPTSGEVELCAMVLPVFWDLAAVLVLRELEAFEPDFVIMNGISRPQQPLWFELGAVNEAMARLDGSTNLAPIEEDTPLVPHAPPEERERPQLLSWHATRAAAELAIETHAEVLDAAGIAFGEVVQGVRFAGYPRPSNTYLCNNVTYVVGYLMDRPGEVVQLMTASDPRDGAAHSLEVTLEGDHGWVPRVFVHWPRELGLDHLPAGAEVLRALVDAQLEALYSGFEPPFHGDNAFADIPPG